MITNDQGRAIIETFEGLRLKAYRCPAGVLTIGFGHTRDSEGKLDVKEGDVITQHQAEVMLEFDLQQYEQAVAKLAPKANANQFSAFVSLAYNIGTAAFAKSTLLRLFNEGGPLAAAHRFADWRFGGKNKDGTPRELPGLVKRRAAEKALFLTGVS